MATKQSVQEANRQSVPAVQIAPNDKGKERVVFYNYVCSGFASGDLLECFLIPKGARLTTWSFTHDGLGASCTLTCGTAAAASRYKAATAVATAGTVGACSGVAENFGDVLTADTVLTHTLAGANATDGKVILGAIKYIEP